MSSVIESCRAALEDKERAIHLAAQALHTRDVLLGGRSLNEEKDIVSSLQNEDGSPLLRRPLECENLARNLIDVAKSKSEYAIETCDSEELEAEKAVLTLPDNNSLSGFYDKLRDLREAHDKASTNDPTIGNFLRAVGAGDGSVGDKYLLGVAHKSLSFSGEEAGGRFLDLQPYFAEYVNLLHQENVPDYLQYIRTLDSFDTIDDNIKKKGKYREYLKRICQYLEEFSRKVCPLADISARLKRVDTDMRDNLQKRLEVMTKGTRGVEELEKYLTLDELKSVLAFLSLKTGGTARQRSKRIHEFMEKLKGEEVNFGNLPILLEARIKFFVNDVLKEERESTIANIEKKLSLSYQEVEAERDALQGAEEGVAAEEGDESESEREIDNPKDLPLGWDGRPIPFWLYKLYGLNHEFACEICGDAVYKGPRAFQRHFTDSQHIHGLRCLGISYSKHFFMVTKIEDAKLLKSKLTEQRSKSAFDADAEEEFEDENGNVMNKKTYEDLHRQGLV